MTPLQNPSVIEAVQQAAQAYGIRRVAAALDKAPSTVYSELNPWGDRQKAKLGLEDAALIAKITGDVTGFALIAHEMGYCLTRKAAAPDKETVAEELVDDLQGLGRWADVCTDPAASKAEVEREAAALVDEIIETKELKLREKS